MTLIESNFLRPYTLYHIFIVVFFLFSCKEKEEETVTPLAKLSLGEDQLNIADVKVQIKPTDYDTSKSGNWTLIKGLIDSSKVYFSDNNSANTVFYGLPGERYTLVFATVDRVVDTILVSFDPLNVEVTFESIKDSETQTYISGTLYDDGKWEVLSEGYYKLISHESEKQKALFTGDENKTYTIKWTTNYGIKSYSKIVEFTSGEYSEYEAQEALQFEGSYTLDENEHIVELQLFGNGIGWRFSKPEEYPALKGFRYLKKVTVFGDALEKFPIAFFYLKKLEYIDLTGNFIDSIPDEISSLTNLKTLIISLPQRHVNITTLPATMCSLEKLEHLDLMGNTVILPECFYNSFPNLKHLDLSFNELYLYPEVITRLEKSFPNANLILNQ